MFQLMKKFGLSGYYKNEVSDQHENINEICIDFTMNLMARSGLSIMRPNVFSEKIIRWIGILSCVIMSVLSIIGLGYAAPMMHYLKLCQTLGTVLQVLIKLFVVQFYKNDFVHIRNDTSKFWRIEDLSSPDKEKYQFMYKFINKLIQLFIIIGTCLLIIYHLKPVFGFLSFYTWRPEGSKLAFWLISIVGLLSVDTMMLFVIGFDCTFVTICINARNQFAILRRNLLELDYDSADADVKVDSLINYHAFLLRHVKYVNITFSAFFLVQYILIAFTLCSHVAVLAIENLNFVETAEIFIYLIVVFYQFSLYCFALDEVTSQADIIDEAIFHSSWYSRHGIIKSRLPFMIMRSQKGCTFTAGGMAKMDRTSIIVVFRMCLSIWTLVHTLKKI